MTTAHGERVIPALTLGWRLKMARSMTGLGVRDFAEQIGVSHGTVTSAELDQRAVRPITIKMWAMATGVDLDWLNTGVVTADNPDGGPGESGSTPGYAHNTRALRPNVFGPIGHDAPPAGLDAA